MKDTNRLKEAQKQIQIVLDSSNGDAQSLREVEYLLHAEIGGRESGDE